MEVKFRSTCGHSEFVTRGSRSTCLGFIQRVDDYGRPTNADPNTVTTGYACAVCDKSYVKISRGWITEFFEVGKDAPFAVVDEVPTYLRGE